MEINSVSGQSYFVDTNKLKNNISDIKVTETISQNNTNSSKILTEKQSKAENDENKKESKKENEAYLNLLKSAIDKTNNKLMMRRTRCEFTIYEDINRVAIKVIDRDTDKVVREIPPEESLELVQKLWELAGLIVDEKR